LGNFVIGMHIGHNSSAAIIENGSLIYAVQEERLTRIKNQGGLPEKGLKEIEDKIYDITTNNCTIQLANGWKTMFRGFWQRDDLLRAYENSSRSLISSVQHLGRKTKIVSDIIDSKRLLKAEEKVKGILKSPEVKITPWEHHLCHAAAAYHGWGKMDEKILILTCDGSGDGICASVNIGYAGQIERIAEVEQSNSIGRLYSNVTYLMGMVPLEHEYKIMGLAPYSEKAKETALIANKLEELFIFNKKNPLIWQRNGCPPMQYAHKFLSNLFMHKRFDHIASGVQKFLENFLVKWVQNCIRETGIKKVACSGGVFMNVKANQKILELPEVEEFFIFPSCGDETNAIGAGWLLYRDLYKDEIKPLNNIYLGGAFDNNWVQKELSEYKFKSKVHVEYVKDIEKRVAELLAKHEIVARFKGRMEFGARALGNRSILANPSNPKVVRVINEMIKNRDFWMPFAQSVLAERSQEYFIKPKGMKAPYMIITFDTREEKREKIMAAIHPYDYTGRVQEVFEDWNPDYYKLIKYFEGMTGEGCILNTSFNLHGEPLVYSPKDALRVFDISGLKYLALEDFLLKKIED